MGCDSCPPLPFVSRQSSSRTAASPPPLINQAESIIKRAREVDPENKAVAKVARKIAKIRAREAAQRKRMAKAMFG